MKVGNLSKLFIAIYLIGLMAVITSCGYKSKATGGAASNYLRQENTLQQHQMLQQGQYLQQKQRLQQMQQNQTCPMANQTVR